MHPERGPRGHRLPSLHSQAEQHAHEEHSRRLAELHQLAPLLDRMEPLRPALDAAGLHFGPRDLSLHWYRPDGTLGRRLRALRIHTRPLSGDLGVTQRWLDTLTAQGFREIHRDDSRHYPQAILQRGHLLLVVDAPAPACVAAAQAKAQHQRRAEDAFADAQPC